MRELFYQSPHFSFRDDIFYQSDLQIPAAFEKAYVSLREKERRILPDEMVRSLPDVPPGHPLQKEWKVRKSTLKRLMRYLIRRSRGKSPSILEVGCGNGWLSNHLAGIENSEVLATDVNETELLQAARVFSDRRNLCFVYADILTAVLPNTHFDYIIFASSIQYFPRLDDVIHRLLEFSRPSGEILIMDTPFYTSQSEAHEAQQRSFNYFQSMGSSEMSGRYFHRRLRELEDFDYKLLYNPFSFVAFIERSLFGKVLPVFPIIQIKNR